MMAHHLHMQQHAMHHRSLHAQSKPACRYTSTVLCSNASRSWVQHLGECCILYRPADLLHSITLPSRPYKTASLRVAARAAANAAYVHAPEDEDELDAHLRVKLMLAEGSGKLDLTDCRLDKLPAQVFRLTGLEELSLAGNNLTSLPEGIGALTNLKRLGLAGNQLCSLPTSIGNLTQLEGLWLHGNLLKELPASMASLTALKQLSLSGNQLTQLPDIWSDMQQLEDLAVAGNQLEQLPASLGSLTALKKLSLNGNSLATLPETLSGLQVLQELWLQGNNLTHLPDSISSLKGLKELSLADNYLESLPARFTKLVSLQKMWLYGNRLAGLPHNMISCMPALTQVWLEGNPGLVGSVVADLLKDVSSLKSSSQTDNNLLRRTSDHQQSANGNDSSWRLSNPAGLNGSRFSRQSLSADSTPPMSTHHPFKALGLDTQQLQGTQPDLIKAAAPMLKVGQVIGSGRGYFKLAPSPITTTSMLTSGQVPTDEYDNRPQQPVLVVALGSAPGQPNWGGLLGRLYKAAQNDAERCFDVLYVVDPARQWYGATHSSEDDHHHHPSLQYYYERLQQYTQRYKHVVMLGDSMGATAGLLFSPLATHVLAFCPQVDLSTSCMRPGLDYDSLALLKSAVLQAVNSIQPALEALSSEMMHDSTSTGRTCTVVAFSGTWQHDLDQINALPNKQVQHRVFSLDSHRLALYLDNQGKLLPLVQAAVLGPLGLASRTVRTANLL